MHHFVSHIRLQKTLFKLIDRLLSVVGGLFETGPGAYGQSDVVALAAGQSALLHLQSPQRPGVAVYRGFFQAQATGNTGQRAALIQQQENRDVDVVRFVAPLLLQLRQVLALRLGQLHVHHTSLVL